MEKITCPKCENDEAKRVYSNGGPAIYLHLVCTKCGFEGGTSRVYTGEKERVTLEIRERFALKREDAVKTFCDGIRASV